jgi:hypothetical protein
LVRTQYYGGMIWGISFALHEQAIIDARSGRVMNSNLAEYHVPVNADVPSVETILVEEVDPHVNPLGIKGVGEIGITGKCGIGATSAGPATARLLVQTKSWSGIECGRCSRLSNYPPIGAVELISGAEVGHSYCAWDQPAAPGISPASPRASTPVAGDARP